MHLASHGRAPYGRAPCICAPYGRAPHGLRTPSKIPLIPSLLPCPSCVLIAFMLMPSYSYTHAFILLYLYTFSCLLIPSCFHALISSYSHGRPPPSRRL